MTAASKGRAGRSPRKGKRRQPSGGAPGAGPTRWITVVVDRREGDVLVLVDDTGRSTDVPIARIPSKSRSEGAVLRVPLDSDGQPVWEESLRDRVEERRRRALLEAQVKRLEATDRGGDIVL